MRNSNKGFDMRAIAAISRNPATHTVGDGFPVKNIFAYDLGPGISPFLLMDYGGPVEFPPAERQRGVESHPHRGFETVTIVFAGELEHRDSAGNHGTIGPGDVQWMTAASGVLHEEKHTADFTKRGGSLEMIQLWVNLPAKHKMDPPAYQTLLAKDIPTVTLGDGTGTVRMIAGEFQGTKGPARTFTPINLWDARLAPGARVAWTFPNAHNAAVLVRRGAVVLNDREKIVHPELALFDRNDGEILLETPDGADVLILSGTAIDEPIAAGGPFVMNTHEEIRQAFDDYRHGRIGLRK
jgi:redox-sensitive bicupin YhaK (pirin superfamily)